MRIRSSAGATARGIARRVPTDMVQARSIAQSRERLRAPEFGRVPAAMTSAVTRPRSVSAAQSAVELFPRLLEHGPELLDIEWLRERQNVGSDSRADARACERRAVPRADDDRYTRILLRDGRSQRDAGAIWQRHIRKQHVDRTLADGLQRVARSRAGTGSCPSSLRSSAIRSRRSSLSSTSRTLKHEPERLAGGIFGVTDLEAPVHGRA